MCEKPTSTKDPTAPVAEKQEKRNEEETSAPSVAEQEPGSDELVDKISKEIFEKYAPAFEELAKGPKD